MMKHLLLLIPSLLSVAIVYGEHEHVSFWSHSLRANSHKTAVSSAIQQERLLETTNASTTNTAEDEHHDDEEETHDDHQDEVELTEDERDPDHDDGEEHDDDHHDHGDEADPSLVSSSSASQNNEDEAKPWGAAIGAALIVNLATLVGLVVLIPTLMAGTLCWAKRWNTASTEQIHNRHSKFLKNYIPSFGAGALLATAVFLIIPESILLLTAMDSHGGHEGHRELQEDNAESNMAWKFGASLLGGFLIPVVLAALFPHAAPDPTEPAKCLVCREREEALLAAAAAATANEKNVSSGLGDVSTAAISTGCNEACCNDHEQEQDDDTSIHVFGHKLVYRDGMYMEEPDEVVVAVEADESIMKASSTLSCIDEECTHDCEKDETPIKTPPKKPINYKFGVSLLLGDMFHNFADGIFLGNAFLLCSRSVAYAILAATVYHELAQELADYFLLTTHVGLPPWKALVLNFISGFSVLFGVIIIFAIPVSVTATGCILAVSAGVYLYIAASECLPRVEHEIKTLMDRFSAILCFVLGAVPIGLVLISHGHCEA